MKTKSAAQIRRETIERVIELRRELRRTERLVTTLTPKRRNSDGKKAKTGADS